MRIRNQLWIETDTHLVLTLHEPFWSAWSKYGWERGIEGLGVSLEAINQALRLKKKIRVNVLKYGSYQITPTQALNKAGDYKFVTRDHKSILVIPRNLFDRIPTEKKVKKYEKKEYERSIKKAEIEQRCMF